jgi:hypothetical protein
MGVRQQRGQGRRALSPRHPARDDRGERRRPIVKASVGDRIVIRGHRIGEPDRDCEIIEVRGPDGSSPYLVRWEDSGHETLFFPGTDAEVEHFEKKEEHA